MKPFQKILSELLSSKITVEEVVMDYKKDAEMYANRIVMGHVKPSDPELAAFLRLCLDVYTYSVDGAVLIPDSLYDICMSCYKSGGNDVIVFADTIGKKWNFINHEIPGVVGTINKVYSYKEFKSYCEHYHGVASFNISPKYDGISADIKVSDGVIVSAATRYNGIQGQDITALIKRAKKDLLLRWINEYPNGHFKCELCVSTEDFNKVVEIKRYSNRRSATSGIINTPSNLELGKYVTIIPLAYYDTSRKNLRYIAPGSKVIPFYSPADLFDAVEVLLESVKDKDFPYRVDGVVVSPLGLRNIPNEEDLMDTSIAYKINTAEGKTRIQYGYMSVGRTGKAVPCLKVDPVEVNETIVTDVSLNSYEKFLSMDLHEGEEVIVYSAGDVIPQVKLPQVRMNFDNAPPLNIEKVCPYCGEHLTRRYAEYSCTNPNCIRVITGRITNFLDKLGVQGFSDKTVELIYESLKVDTIQGFLNLSINALLNVPGFSDVSAQNLVDEITKLRENTISISKFFGALGIDGISEKKCRKIFDTISLNDALLICVMASKQDITRTKQYQNMYYALQAAAGIGEKTADTFMTFLADCGKEIADLVDMLHLGSDTKYVGNFAFTGFRPTPDIIDRINRLGYDVNTSTVTKETVVLFTASLEKKSSKMNMAEKLGIPIYHASKINDVLTQLENG